MFGEFIKPDHDKKRLTLFIILFVIGLLGFMIFLRIYIPKIVAILKIIALPFQLIPLFNLSSIFILPLLVLTLFWIYFVSCVLIYLKNKIFNGKWNAKKVIVLIIIILLGVITYGFFKFGGKDLFIPTADDSGATTAGVASVVKANNQFALDLYSKINKEDSDNNIFFSPLSISTALAMTYEGARGNTADEIQNVFHFPEDNNSRRSSFAKILNGINKAGGKYELHTANAIWVQKDYPFLKDYEDTISRYYVGEIKNMDFVNNPGSSSSEINNWVSKNTNNKIKEIVSPSMLNAQTRAVLTNAIYFKGKWEHPFDKSDTKQKDFTLNSGAKIKVQMMMLQDNDLRFNYTESDGVQIVEMPYQGDKISMIVLLPRTNITHLESILSEEKLKEWRSEWYPNEVYIYMPKYGFETSYSLTNYLKDMGMNLPFAWPGADFSGMDGTKMLHIDEVLHKAYIDVYEEGTEAAAATVVTMTFGAAISHPLEFRADHPFIFIIQEKETGNILFIGRVNNPIQQ